MQVYIHILLYMCIYIYIYIDMHIDAYTNIYTYIYIYIYNYIHRSIHIYIYTHTWGGACSSRPPPQAALPGGRLRGYLCPCGARGGQRPRRLGADARVRRQARGAAPVRVVSCDLGGGISMAFAGAPLPPVVPFYPFSGEGSPTKIDYSKKGTLILTSPLEDLIYLMHIYLYTAYIHTASGTTSIHTLDGCEIRDRTAWKAWSAP